VFELVGRDYFLPALGDPGLCFGPTAKNSG